MSVGGTLGVTGQTTLGNTNVGGTLGVNGQTQLGNARVNGTLGVTGQTTLGNANVDGTFGVNGVTNVRDTNVLGGLEVTGQATLKYGLVATGYVSLFNMAQSLSSSGGTYAAKTDGFLVGSVIAPGDPGKLSIGWIAGTNSDGVKVCATGGNLGAFDSSSRGWRAAHNESFTLPVRRGTTFSASLAIMSGNQDNPGFAFWWIPLGSGWATESIEKISDEYPPIDVAAFHRDPLSYEQNIKTLIAVMETSFDKQISRENNERLLSAFMDLQV